MIKAANEANLTATFYTFFASSPGTPSAIGAAGAEKVKALLYWHPNNEIFVGKELVESFKKKYNDDYFPSATCAGVALLAKAIKTVKASDPMKVACAMEGMKVHILNGEVEMRRQDHQLQQPLYMVTWIKTNGREVKYDHDNTGHGWRTDQKIDTRLATLPTSCQMIRSAM